jgi:serine/threonine-protein kinase
MVHDLEEVLAIEVARTGETTGEATTVLRALKGDTADFAPLRLRNPRRWILSVLAVLTLAGAALIYLANRTERGSGGAATPPAAGLSRVDLASSAANDYDPEGDDRESDDSTQNAIDGNPSTEWNTERYNDGLKGVGKNGVGLFVDAGSPIAGKALEVRTSTPGFTAAIYGANDVPKSIEGWTRLSRDTQVGELTRIKLRGGTREFRRYLVWITALPEGNKAAIQELTLFR